MATYSCDGTPFRRLSSPLIKLLCRPGRVMAAEGKACDRGESRGFGEGAQRRIRSPGPAGSPDGLFQRAVRSSSTVSFAGQGLVRPRDPWLPPVRAGRQQTVPLSTSAWSPARANPSSGASAHPCVHSQCALSVLTVIENGVLFFLIWGLPTVIPDDPFISQ